MLKKLEQSRDQGTFFLMGSLAPYFRTEWTLMGIMARVSTRMSELSEKTTAIPVFTFKVRKEDMDIMASLNGESPVVLLTLPHDGQYIGAIHVPV